MSKRILNRTVIACLSRTFEFAFISLFVASKSKDTSGWKFSLYDNCERDERIVERGTKAKKKYLFPYVDDLCVCLALHSKTVDQNENILHTHFCNRSLSQAANRMKWKFLNWHFIILNQMVEFTWEGERKERERKKTSLI